jgi:uncharacterized protein YecT (DUF1311 family)
MRVIALALGLTIAFSYQAVAETDQLCDKAPDNAKFLECADRELKKADAELNRVYGALLKRVSEGSEAVPGYGTDPATALREAQRAWITFRDKNCHWKSTSFYGGSGQSTIVAGCLVAVTRARVAELKSFDQN